VAPVLDHPAARDHDVANGRIATGEQQVVQCRVRDRTDHGSMLCIQHQPVGAMPHFDRSGRLADGLRAMLRSVTPESRSHVRLRFGREDAALLQAADDLFEKSIVTDETWKTLSERYNTEQMMDAVFTVGQYNLVSWALNSLGVPLDDYLPGSRK